jgi:hypothetical protein
MCNPKRSNYVHQNNCKPKDGKGSNQAISEEMEDPHSIFTHSEYGDYGNQAHHCISGNEIMKNHALEKLISNNDGAFKLKGETGYTINNGDNGVFLPSYPQKNYTGSNTNKYNIVKLAMEAGHGQVHIGGHTGHEHAVGQDYPKAIKKELTKLKQRILLQSEECPFCIEDDGKLKTPFVPPYKVNQWLDKLSDDIKTDLTGPVADWPYFISKYAKRYFEECNTNKLAEGV